MKVEKLIVPGTDGAPPRLDRITFALEPGECLVIAGGSGSGKTTLLKALAGIAPAPIGAVYLDEASLANIDGAALRRQMGVVEQNPCLFHGTIRENIAKANPGASFEKVVIDCEMIQQWMYYNQPVKVDEGELAVDAIREVGPNGHFFGCQHTQDRYRDAFYNPLLSDWRNFEAWVEAGAQTAHERAHHLYKRILREYEPPPIDEAVREELQAFIAKRKEEGGAKTDF